MRCEVAKRLRAINQAAINEVRLTDAPKDSVENVDESSASKPGVPERAVEVVARDEGMAARLTPNRRKREDYNAYMKQKMREYRERKKAQ